MKIDFKTDKHKLGFRRVMKIDSKTIRFQLIVQNFNKSLLLRHKFLFWEWNKLHFALSLSMTLNLFHQIKIHERNKMQNKAIWNVGKEHRGTFRFSKSRCSLRKKENYKIEKRNKRVKQ